MQTKSVSLARFKQLLLCMSVATASYAVADVDRLPARAYVNQPDWQTLEQVLIAEDTADFNRKITESNWLWQNNRIHIDRINTRNATAKVILIHGFGMNGRLMTILSGKALANQGYETIAPDMPSFGLTQIGEGNSVGFDTWVELINDLVNREKERDARPIFVVGLGEGSQAAFEASYRNPNIAGLIGDTFGHLQVKNKRDGSSDVAISSVADRTKEHWYSSSILDLRVTKPKSPYNALFVDNKSTRRTLNRLDTVSPRVPIRLIETANMRKIDPNAVIQTPALLWIRPTNDVGQFKPVTFGIPNTRLEQVGLNLTGINTSQRLTVIGYFNQTIANFINQQLQPNSPYPRRDDGLSITPYNQKFIGKEPPFPVEETYNSESFTPNILPNQAPNPVQSKPAYINVPQTYTPQVPINTAPITSALPRVAVYESTPSAPQGIPPATLQHLPRLSIADDTNTSSVTPSGITPDQLQRLPHIAVTESTAPINVPNTYLNVPTQPINVPVQPINAPNYSPPASQQWINQPSIQKPINQPHSAPKINLPHSQNTAIDPFERSMIIPTITPHSTWAFMAPTAPFNLEEEVGMVQAIVESASLYEQLLPLSDSSTMAAMQEEIATIVPTFKETPLIPSNELPPDFESEIVRTETPLIPLNQEPEPMEQEHVLMAQSPLIQRNP